MNERDILNLIKSDPWMMKVLEVAASLNLPDWMIGAGFVRNRVWDHLHELNNEKVQTKDIDLIYYDPSDLSRETEKEFEKRLKKILDINWEVRNQARMHEKRERTESYKNSVEAMSGWPETATAIGVKLDSDGDLKLFAPHGIDDLTNLIVRPTPVFKNDLTVFWKRIEDKNWLKIWPKLKVVTD